MIPSNSLVFLIDDDASVRKGVSRLLRSAGYKNEAFRSVSDFLARTTFGTGLPDRGCADA
jgi:FixJ family two-component response regulator